MEDLQTWLEPLLWIVGAITALVAFVRLCKPVWKIFTVSKEFTEKIDAFDKKLDDKFNKIEDRFEIIEDHLDFQKKGIEELNSHNQSQDTITLSLLHDAIVQIYQEAKEKGFISEVSYYRACELYKQNGNSQYIDSVMAALTEMHAKGMVKSEQ